jgi:hypothetical protein
LLTASGAAIVRGRHTARDITREGEEVVRVGFVDGRRQVQQRQHDIVSTMRAWIQLHDWMSCVT